MAVLQWIRQRVLALPVLILTARAMAWRTARQGPQMPVLTITLPKPFHHG